MTSIALISMARFDLLAEDVMDSSCRREIVDAQ
jgi:hypothetical protein